MNRIEKKFNELKENNKKALITYITAGDPSIEKTEQLIYAKERAGASIIEVGIPFSDPLADGPIIQKAAQNALNNGIKLKDIFNCIERVRKNTEISMVFLVYYNTILAYGIKEFVDKCEEIGIDGFVIPDLPLEEQDEIIPYIKKNNVALIPLVAPTSKERIKDVVEGKKGFVYCISSLGVTGMKDGFYEEVDEFLKTVKKHTDLPIAIGFGISSREDVERFTPYVDGVIVGSAIVKKIHETKGDIEEVEKFIYSEFSVSM
ncbi:tryptophan synthase subunit alpha [Clostridium aestuarii]|uniref:Tryptophan synthase alpha chain n=1 Tax=Clostridium aestuarii TaxID=338193 RepID=A0ABT4CZ14_9CLOT|nr:tryptophan synthase subunit alpha [Clostridium aestuarii]MCY6483205.1 tryptophan synthase subunit alpha [Clostridium aestuarii]